MNVTSTLEEPSVLITFSSLLKRRFDSPQDIHGYSLLSSYKQSPRSPTQGEEEVAAEQEESLMCLLLMHSSCTRIGRCRNSTDMTVLKENG